MARTRAGAAHGGSIVKKAPQQKAGNTQTRTTKRKANGDTLGENDISRRHCVASTSSKGATSTTATTETTETTAPAEISHPCVWSKYNTCLLADNTESTPLPCQHHDGCDNVVHHLCQIAWQSENNIQFDSISRYCPDHHSEFNDLHLIQQEDTSTSAIAVASASNQ